MSASIVDTAALLKVVWVSLLGGIGVTVAFSLAVFGAARGGEARRGERRGPAPLYYLVTFLGLAVCAWAVWRGYDFVVTKS